MKTEQNDRLKQMNADLDRALSFSTVEISALYPSEAIRRETAWVTMRDGVQLATDVYFPPKLPAPCVARRTPYGRATAKVVEISSAIAQRGYVVIAQDCRGTGDSGPDTWDYYVYESEDSFDFVEWVVRQEWFDGFLGALGASYVAQTQWCMATHPRMSAIVPEVSGLGVATNTAHLHMFLNAYARSVGKGKSKISASHDELERLMQQETQSTGYFNELMQPPLPAALLASNPALRDVPLQVARRKLWQTYCELPCRGRAEFVKTATGADAVTIQQIESLPSILGQSIAHDAHTLPVVDRRQLAQSILAPALMITGWYDWGLNDALATWTLLNAHGRSEVRSRSRLIITPSAHNMPGYHEGASNHPELRHNHRCSSHVDLLLKWYEAARSDSLESWPAVIYYLMAANEWRTSPAWPPPRAQSRPLYLSAERMLSWSPPRSIGADRYVYDPTDPTPTLGGSIVSYVYTPGSVDVSVLHRRADMLSYFTAPLQHDLDVVGPLRMVLYASTTALDTDFCVRLSDCFPDGRVVQLQNGILRARFRDDVHDPTPLEPGRIYRLEIDMWATANRFRAGHRICLDVSSSDFPRYDRNTNLGGRGGDPLQAVQTIHHDPRHPSHLLLPVLDDQSAPHDPDRHVAGLMAPAGA